ncbi:hypothetical protein [Streptomyces mirabilis]|uniref:hypothetical protein n=1 Tax=Streptomyces mirabilis TaxID=68239 RepID=UPI0033DFBEFA
MSLIDKLRDRHLARHRYYKELRAADGSLRALSEDDGVGRVQYLRDLAKHEQIMSGLHPQGWPHRAANREDKDGYKRTGAHAMRARLYLLLAFAEDGTYSSVVATGEYEYAIEPTLTKLTRLSNRAGAVGDTRNTVLAKAALLNELWMAARPWIGEAAAEAVFAVHRALLLSAAEQQRPPLSTPSASPGLHKTPTGPIST